MRHTLPLAAFGLLAALCLAQEACNGTLNGTAPVSGVVVDGGACVLDGAVVSGDVRVSNGGSLTTLANTTIAGVISASDAGDLDLDGALKVGNVMVTGQNATYKVRVGPAAEVGGVALSDVGSFVARGAVGSVSATRVTNILLQGARVAGGLSAERGDGPVVLCGATVAGGISLDGVAGVLFAVSGPGCGQSALSGPLNVAGGSGGVRIEGNEVSGMNVLVRQHAGNVSIVGARLNDVVFENVVGDLRLRFVSLNGGSYVSHSAGMVSVAHARVGGDFAVSDSLHVSIAHSDFAHGVVSAMRNADGLTMASNSNFTALVGSNTKVLFRNNRAGSAEFTGNRGSTTISANYLGSLSCVGNDPPPTAGSTNNTISDGASGQCAAF